MNEVVVIKKNRYWYSIKLNQSPNIEIMIGRNQKGNQDILDLYKPVDIKCWWFHLHPSTSAHVILYDKGEETTSMELQQAFRYIYKELFRSNKETIYCKLTDVKCTTTLGKVEFKNESYCYLLEFNLKE